MFLDRKIDEEDRKRVNEEMAGLLRRRPGTHEVDPGTWGAFVAIQFNTIQQYGRMIQEGESEPIDVSKPDSAFFRDLLSVGDTLDMPASETVALTAYTLRRIDEFLAEFIRSPAFAISARTPEVLDALQEEIHKRLAALTIVTDGATYVFGYERGVDDGVPRKIVEISERYRKQCEQHSSGRSE